MEPITETCAVCQSVCEGLDDGFSLEHWPDGEFLTPDGPWVCMDCIPDGWRAGRSKSIPDLLAELRALRDSEASQ